MFQSMLQRTITSTLLVFTCSMSVLAMALLNVLMYNLSLCLASDMQHLKCLTPGSACIVCRRAQGKSVPELVYT